MGWREAESLQLGLGRMTLTASAQVEGECPHASGDNLNRVGEQYGIGRPSNFNDCCYWLLIVLLLFEPGPLSWLMRSVGELYTGIRPGVVETPALIQLVWNPTTGLTDEELETYWDDTGTSGVLDGGFYDMSAIWNADGQDASPVAEDDGFWLEGAHEEADSFWSSAGGLPTGTLDRSAAAGEGLDLLGALAWVKPAGVALVLSNEPNDGKSGCSGVNVRNDADQQNLFYTRWA